MKLLLLIILSLQPLVALAAQPAQPICDERKSVVKKLFDVFGETLKSVGLEKAGGVIEVYSSDETGSWTILITRPDSISCLVASGQMWEQEAIPLPGDPV